MSIVDVAKAASRSAGALQALLGANVPRALKEGKLNLYETLSRLPASGVGARVHQTRWASKGIADCYWRVTECRTKNEGKSGKAWGVLVWRGKEVNTRPERIPGALKYHWREGMSVGTVLSTPTSPTLSARPA